MSDANHGYILKFRSATAPSDSLKNEDGQWTVADEASGTQALLTPEYSGKRPEFQREQMARGSQEVFKCLVNNSG